MNEIQSLIEKVYAFSEERDWHQFHTPENLAKSISIEAGELLECYQWNKNAKRENVETFTILLESDQIRSAAVCCFNHWINLSGSRYWLQFS